jgi:hypothetical protein
MVSRLYTEDQKDEMEENSFRRDLCEFIMEEALEAILKKNFERANSASDAICLLSGCTKEQAATMVSEFCTARIIGGAMET